MRVFLVGVLAWVQLLVRCWVCLLRGLGFLAFVFFFLFSSHSFAQVTADFPPLRQGLDEGACNGNRSVIIRRDPAQTESLWVRVVLWDPYKENERGFELYRNEGSGFKRISPADGARGFRDSVRSPGVLTTPFAYFSVPGSAKWRYRDIEITDPFPKDVIYELVNSENVFFVGVAYSATRPTTFTYTEGLADLPSILPLRYYDVLGQEQPFTGGAIKICKGDDLTVSARIGLEDRFHYSWTPGVGVMPPIDSSTVTILGILDDTDYTVTRRGMCDMSVSASFRVEVQERIEPVLSSSAANQCGPGQVIFTADDLGVATEVRWYFHQDGAGEGYFDFLYADPVTAGVPVARGIDVMYKKVIGGNPNGDPGGEPVTHIVRAIASDGNCPGVIDKEFTVYPGLPAPVIDVANPTNTTQCSPYVVTLDNTATGLPKGTQWFWEVYRIDGGVPVPYASSQEDRPRQEFKWNGVGVKQFRVDLLLKDKSGNCSAAGTRTLDVKPGIAAYFTADLVPRTGCSPVDITLTDVSEGAVHTRTWTYTSASSSYNWGSAPVYRNPAFSVAATERGKVRLTVENSAGCTSFREAEFEFKAAPACDPLIPHFPDGSECSPLKVELTANNIVRAVRYSWRVKSDPADPGVPHGEGGALAPSQTSLTSEFTFTNSTITPIDKIIQLELFSDEGCSRVLEYVVRVPGKLIPRITHPAPEGCPDRFGNRPVVIADFSDAPANSIYVWTLNGTPVVPTGTAPDYEFLLQNMDVAASVNQTVRLEITSPTGCVRHGELHFTTFPRVDPSFTVSYLDAASSQQIWDPAVKLCAPQKVTLHGQGAQVLRWEITNPLYYSDESPKADYETTFENLTNAELTYTVRLHGTNARMCTDFVEGQYTVLPGVISKFEVDPLDECTPYRIRLRDISVAGDAHTAHWHVGDGVENPVGSGIYEFSTPGVKTVYLTSSVGTCSSDSEERYTFEVLPPITAGLAGVTPSDKVCAPALLNFTNTTTGASKVTWYFEGSPSAGGGVENNSPNVDHLFENRTKDPIVRNVTIVATNERGCGHLPASQATIPVTIYPEPLPANDWFITKRCYPLELRFESKSQTLTDYHWVFSPPAGILGQFGTKVERLGQQTGVPEDVVLTNSSPNSTLEYSISYSGSKQWPGGPLCTFGPVQVDKVKVPPALQPNIVPSSLEVCSGEEVVFEDKSKGGALELKWFFGDGGEHTSAHGELASHTFLNTGTSDKTFNVSVNTRQLEFDCSATSTFEVLVHPQVDAKFAHAIPTDRACDYPFPIIFTNQTHGNTTNIGYSSEYEWDYGYSVAGVAQRETLPHVSPPHTHNFQNDLPNSEIEYTVTLVSTQTYTSGKVCQGDFSAPVKVPPALVPAFTVDEPEGCIPHSVTLTPTGTGGGNLKYTWDFGDGGQALTTYGNGDDVRHVYNNLANTAQHDYTIVLTAENDRGCIGTSIQTVRTYPKVTAAFNLSSTQFCTPDALTVTNNSQNAAEYIWQLTGVGAPSVPTTTTTDSFTIPINNSTNTNQSYALTLHAREIYGGVTCEDKISKSYVALPPVVSSFSVLPGNVGCAPFDVSFSNNSSGASAYRWSIDEQIVSNGLVPDARSLLNSDRANGRVYQIKLEALNALGCSSVSEQDITVLPFVESVFVLSDRAGCTPLDVVASVDPGKQSPQYVYSWTIRGGTPATASASSTGVVTFLNETASPPSPLEGTVKLVTSLAGHPECSAEHEETVVVYPAVYPAFDVQDEACTPYTAKFQNFSDVYDEPKANYTWIFNDAVTSSDSVMMQGRDPENAFTNTSYTADKVISAKLKVRSSHGCEDSLTKQITVHPLPKAFFSIMGATESCPPFDLTLQNESEGTDLSFFWDFGDGSTQTVTDLSPLGHRYDNTSNDVRPYTISLTATTAYNCVSSFSQPVRVFPGVTANFNFLPGDVACSPFDVQLSNLTSGATSFQWDFGDGFTSDMVEPVHTFKNETVNDVVYNVTLSASSEHDCSATLTKPITVYATPQANFLPTPSLQVFPNATVAIDNRSNPASPAWKYSWDFGDGVTSTDANPGSHTYARWAPKDWAFTYPIELTIRAPHCSSTYSHDVIVYPPRPITRFDSEDFEGCAPVTVFFRNNTQYADTYLWDFGDGITSTDSEPIHTYTKPGVYIVKLTATGDGGVSHSQGFYTSHVNPTAQFTLHPNRVMLPKAIVKAQNESTDASSFFWDFGDGFTSFEQSPVHQYESPGEYDVKLSVKTEAGCEDEITVRSAILVLPPGKIQFPNVFRPNEFGGNGGHYVTDDTRCEVFHPVTDAVVTNYKLVIFNRWGESLFESNDVKIGWDGYRDGKLCDVGVYAWRATGQFFNGEIFDLRGNVTLLR